MHPVGLLADPLVRGLAPGDPFWWERHARLAREKGLLRRILDAWYREVRRELPRPPGRVLELGSGGGFLAEVLTGALATDLFPRRGLDAAVDAARLPVRDASLRGLVLVNVFHHLPRPADFLRSAVRALRPRGRVVLVEPWITPFSRLVYGRFHHEPCDPEAQSWESPVGGPLDGANEALAWIVFHRDRMSFEREHPGLRLLTIRPQMPLTYLLSGGFSFRPLAPGAAFPVLRLLERPFDRIAAMFAMVVLEREERRGPS